MRRAAWLPCALALWTGGCAQALKTATPPLPDGQIAVELYSGFPAAAPKVKPAPVHVLVDITPLMTPELADGPAAEQLNLARTLAEPYLKQRADLAGAEFHPFHSLSSSAQASCPDSASGRSSAASEALGRLQQDLAARNQAADARVVLFASFRDQCSPRLCEAAARLVEPGTWLDAVAVGSEQKPPACLAELRPSAQAPIPWLAGWSQPAAPSFAVEAVTASGSTPPVVAQGTAGGPAVSVSPGVRRLRVALDPPELIGPIRVRPGDRLRVRLMDFPLSAPNERMWVVEPIDDKR